MRNKGALDNKAVYALIILSLIAISILGLFIAEKFIGFATYIPAEAGYITEVEIKMKYDNHVWAGAWGFAIWIPGYSGAIPTQTFEGDTVKQVNNMFFDCMAKEGTDMFATTASSIDWDTVTAGNTSLVDDFMNVSASYPLSGTNTFTQEISIMLGNTNISNIPAIFTFQANVQNSTRFDVGVLTDGDGNLIFVTTRIIPSTPETVYSDAEEVYANYQAILPIPENTSQTYNFFRDPFDSCPSGTESFSNGTISGTVRDNRTNATLANTTVIVGTVSTTTDQYGNYSIFTIEGRYTVVGLKDGYKPNLGISDIYGGLNTTYDIYMEPALPYVEIYGTLTGNVTDNATGALLNNVTVSIGITSDYTNINGTYTLSASAGNYTLVGYKEGYYPHVGVVRINSSMIIGYNFGLSEIPEEGQGPGQGAGQGAGSGSGDGAGTPTVQRIVIERPGQINYYIGIQSLRKKVRIGQFIQDVIKIYNFQGIPLNLEMIITGDVAPYVHLDKTFLSIDRKSDGNFTITMFGFNETGTFTGNLVFSGDLNESIPIELVVRSEEKLPIQALVMKLDTFKDSVAPGRKLDYKLDLRNLLTDISYDVGIKYNISNTNKSVNFEINEEYVNIHTFISLINGYKLPKEIEEGTYILTANAKYMNITSTTSTIFYIKNPFYMYALFGFLPLWLLFLILTIIGIAYYFYYRYKKQQEAKRRYVMKVDLKLLPKPGPRAAFLGKIAETEHKAYLDLDKLTTHTIVAGSTGGGKTVAAQDIIEEALLKDIAVIVFDPTAQWSGMLRKLQNKTMLDLYSKFGMKPNEARAFNGNVRDITDAREVIDLKKYLKPGEIQIFSVNKLDPKDIDTFVANTVREVFHANFQEEQELKYMLVYDEVHRLLPKFGGSGEGFIQIERACREFRKWGIGVMLISQVLADFVGQIKANINTELQMRTRDEGDLKRIETKYGKDQLRSLVKASVGSGMIQNAAYNRGLPYFISFRPMMHSIKRLSDEELAKYNKYNNIIDDFEYQLEQLEGEGLDVFDMKLELKLSLDKVKSGSFNMVEIYLEGLTSRLKGEWKKLGKTPKKKTVELIKEAELKKELEKAKSDRDKFLKEEKKEVESKKEVEKIPLFEKIFKSVTFDNGAMVSTLNDLTDALSSMDEETFKGHVNEDKNDILNWIKTEVKNEMLEKKLEKTLNKGEVVKILKEERRKKRLIENIEEIAKVETKVESVDDLINDIKNALENNDVKEAIVQYKKMQTIYLLMKREDKAKYYKTIVDLMGEIKKKSVVKKAA